MPDQEVLTGPQQTGDRQERLTSVCNARCSYYNILLLGLKIINLPLPWGHLVGNKPIRKKKLTSLFWEEEIGTTQAYYSILINILGLRENLNFCIGTYSCQEVLRGTPWSSNDLWLHGPSQGHSSQLRHTTTRTMAPCKPELCRNPFFSCHANVLCISIIMRRFLKHICILFCQSKYIYPIHLHYLWKVLLVTVLLLEPQWI